MEVNISRWGHNDQDELEVGLLSVERETEEEEQTLSETGRKRRPNEVQGRRLRSDGKMGRNCS